MFKTSFKEDFKKTEVFNGRATIVTLKGIIRFPKHFIDTIPLSIMDWAYGHPVVEYHDSIDTAYIIVKGKSVCREGDTFDPVLGERIAESRAKIRIYRFMQVFTEKLCTYYFALIYGKHEKVHNFFALNGNTSLYLANKKYKNLLQHEMHHLTELLQQTVA